MENLRREDFMLTFESQGSTFLFEDIVARHYMTEENLILSDGRRMPVYVSKKALEKIRQVGEARTAAETRRAIDSLGSSARTAARAASTYASQSDLSEKDVRGAFGTLAAVCRDYSYFEPYYWDGAYEKAKDDPDLKESIELVQGYKNKARADLDVVFFQKQGLLAVLVAKLSSQFGISEDDVSCCQMAELAALFGGAQVPRETLAARRAGYAFYMDPDHAVRLLEGKEALALVQKFEKDSLSPQTVIKGRTAHSTGKIVRGRARIVSRDYADPSVTIRRIAEMRDGDIFVSETTDPEMMPALQKAAAIVTDVGGMLSHAAITARELGVPCVVMTGNASKLVKDGDMVEVDAQQSIIKIL